MYRTSEEYDRMSKLAIAILVDYGIKEFPLDMDDLCKKMKINLIPYSAYENKNVHVLLAKSHDGFNMPRSTESEATIFFNDKYGISNDAHICNTKGHEIKHIVEGDIDDSEDDLCEYFSKYLRCPIPYVLYLGIKTEMELISKFGLSSEQAGYVIKGLRNRIAKYGNGYFKYELELLQHLLGDKYDEKDFIVVEKITKES